MTDVCSLAELRVLVVEDDYHLASELAPALAAAGAGIIGPCADERHARAALQAHRSAAVLLDINLGDGPSFGLAAHLRESGIPFVFVTGYDRDVIPAAFRHVQRLEKPVHLSHVTGALAQLTGAAS